MSLEFLIGILKVHEQELQRDGIIKKEKNVALKALKPTRRTSTKALNEEESSKELNSEEDFMEEGEEDELSFISRKIYSMWRREKST